ncbi:MAG TPA: hypothetical protein VH112_10390 [Acidimicrobiales bacterium]|nr:hypothetical protein [Acidimicrobiales bacterium]
MNGHEALAGDRFCGQCGSAVPALATVPAVTPPAGFAENPGPRPTRRWAAGSTTAFVVACLLVLGAAGLGTYAGATGGRGRSSTVSGVAGAIGPAAARPTVARSASPFPTTAPPPGATPVTPPSNVPPTTAPPVAPAAPAVGALAGLGSLVGDWKGHGGDVHIGADGQAQATFRAYRLCTDDPTPPCDTMSGSTIVDGGHAQFRLKPSGTPATATGQVTGSDDPAAFQPGFALTVNLMPGDVMLVTSSPAAQSVAYCGPRASAGACGA